MAKTKKETEKMETRFIALATHQLRTPLSAIKWGLRILLAGDVGKLNKKQKKLLEKIYSNSERAIALIKDLAIVAKIEKGKYILRPVFFQIKELLLPFLKKYKKKIELRWEKKLPKVFADQEKIKLAVENLIENALNYCTGDEKIIISLRKRKAEIEFKIEDQGVGIPKSQQKKVFQKFFRGANVIRMGTVGTGLGLFITKNIIKAHKGKIWFKSQENKGTTFYFTLPVGKV